MQTCGDFPNEASINWTVALPISGGDSLTGQTNVNQHGQSSVTHFV